MQQTENLNLNLIEGTDDVDWVPLNENFQALEQETADIRADIADSLGEVMAAMGSGGKNCRITYGTYTGTGTYGESSPCTLSPGFRPLAVLLATNQYVTQTPAVFLRGTDMGRGVSGQLVYLTWSDSSVRWHNTAEAPAQGNASGYKYYYVVVGD